MVIKVRNLDKVVREGGGGAWIKPKQNKSLGKGGRLERAVFGDGQRPPPTTTRSGWAEVEGGLERLGFAASPPLPCIARERHERRGGRVVSPTHTWSSYVRSIITSL
jgi:hypothetical protein